MNADDYFSRIPDGHRRAMRRPSVPKVDRQLRRKIEEANRNGDCIINVGNGIYRPIPGDPVDEKELHEYLHKEKSRARSLGSKISVMSQTFRSWKGVAAREQQGKRKKSRAEAGA